MGLGLKRLVLVLLSIIGGIAGVFGVIMFIKVAYDPFITFERFGTTYAVLTGVPLALLFGVWFDYFLGTNILPDNTPVEEVAADAVEAVEGAEE